MRIADLRAAETVFVTVWGYPRPVAVRRAARARRMSLRVDPASGAAILTLPRRTPLAEGELFVERHAGWLAARLAALPPALPFVAGGSFPLRGERCRVVHEPGGAGRGRVTLVQHGEGADVVVPGEARHLARRLTGWLKEEARRDLSAAVARHAARLGRVPATVRIGDPRSRWGSCSGRARLSFSWRLVLAPPFVLDYVAAHEVAHLVEMNHSDAFWRLLSDLDPDWEAAQLWLKRFGSGLYAIGRAA
jgi:predicted metal-dependent hydrolase